jgi:integrase
VLTINGKRKYFYGKTKSEVLKKLRAFEERQENGEVFKTVAEQWWDEHSATIAYNTQKPYKPALQRAIDEFGYDFIKDITPVQVSGHIRRFAKSHADKTVRTQLMVYNLIFKYAVENGYVLANPVRDLSVPANLKKEKRTTPDSADLQRVKESTSCPFGLFAYWAMYTGMRRGELLALEWKDVDIANRTISITKSLYEEGGVPKPKAPKTEKSYGKVPILDALLKVIPAASDRVGLVFPNKEGGYITSMQFHRLWQKYSKASGVNATPHQFRHAYATMLYEAGIPPEEMQTLLRHAQLSTTMDIYRDIRESKVKAIHEKVYSVDIN